MPDGPGCFTQDSSCPALLRVPLRPVRVRVRGCHPLWPDFPVRSPPPSGPTSRPYYPGVASTTPVWAPPRSLAATGGITFVLFSCGYLDVSVPRVRPRPRRVTGLQPAGLPHSDIRGSQGACPSPRLFAACRVLLRLREPRYPPSALLCFLFSARPLPGTSRLVLFPFPSHHVKDLSTVESENSISKLLKDYFRKTIRRKAGRSYK